jgi:hypothetical protein
MHIHPHLDLYVDGQKRTVPAQIGIDPGLWRTHKYDRYIGDMGAAPIHTHDASGTLHVESSVTANWTLGNFLQIWGLNFRGRTVQATADGQPVSNYKNVVLKDGEEIVLNVT